MEKKKVRVILNVTVAPDNVSYAHGYLRGIVEGLVRQIPIWTFTIEEVDEASDDA